jgi:hypothetical protein
MRSRDVRHQRVELLELVDEEQNLPALAPGAVAQHVAHVAGLGDRRSTSFCCSWMSCSMVVRRTHQRRDDARQGPASGLRPGRMTSASQGRAGALEHGHEAGAHERGLARTEGPTMPAAAGR